VPSVTITVAIIGSLGTVVGGGLSAWALLRARSTHNPAEMQGEINDGFRAFMDQARDELDACKERDRQFKRQLVFLEARIRGLNQYIASLVALLRRAGIKIPERPALPHYGEEGMVEVREEDLPRHSNGKGEDSS
jgi:hypothetical protein